MASPREPSTLRGGRGVEATVLRSMMENSDFPPPLEGPKIPQEHSRGP